MVSPPRYRLVPAGAVSSLGSDAVELARNAGLVLSDEQQQVLHGGLGVKADGSWSAFEVVNVQPRQNGKSSTLQARILLGLKLGEQIAYTCHRVDASQEVFRGLVSLVEASPELAPLLEKVVYSNGKEAIWLANGGRVVFGTRSSRTGRGFSLDLWVADEAHYLAQEAHNALMPATSAREKAPQVWYAASAVDEQVHEHGLVLARLRERGIKGEAANLAFYEWSLGLLDDEGVELRPEQVTAEMVDDEALWALANPALGSRISVEHVRAEREAMDPRGWIVERLGIGAWPDTSGVAAAPLTGEEWNELCDRDSEQVGEIVLAFDNGPDRRTALVVWAARARRPPACGAPRLASGLGLATGAARVPRRSLRRPRDHCRRLRRKQTAAPRADRGRHERARYHWGRARRRLLEAPRPRRRAGIQAHRPARAAGSAPRREVEAGRRCMVLVAEGVERRCCTRRRDDACARGRLRDPRRRGRDHDLLRRLTARSPRRE
jgi:hypothetical protein